MTRSPTAEITGNLCVVATQILIGLQIRVSRVGNNFYDELKESHCIFFASRIFRVSADHDLKNLDLISDIFKGK